MKNVQSVLFATDFSECAESAREVACDMAVRYGADLHILHAVHSPSLEVPEFGMGLAFPAYVDNLPQQRKEISEASLQALHKIDLGDLDSNKVKYEVAFGQPFSCILDYADEHNIGMIVVGTHGRTGLSHILLGLSLIHI